VRTKIAIGCCNNIFSEAISRYLLNEKDIKVIKTFRRQKTLNASLKELGKSNPDVVIMDMDEEFITCISLFEEPPEKSYRILLLGDKSISRMTDYQLRELLSKGIAGIIPPSSDKAVLKKAIKAIHSGELWLDEGLLVRVLSSIKNKKEEKSKFLAKKEREILYHICQGYKNKEIAQKLNVSEQTVKSHCNRIYKKLGVSDRLQLVVYAKNYFRINK